MRKAIAALAVAASLAVAAPAQAAVPIISISGVEGFGSSLPNLDYVHYLITPTFGVVKGCDSSVTMDYAHPAMPPGTTNHVGVRVSGTRFYEADMDPVDDYYSTDIAAVDAECRIRYRVRVHKTVRESRDVNGVSTVNRSIRGNCNWANLGDGQLLMTCLGGQATATYRISGPGRGVKAGAVTSAGLWPCGADVDKELLRGSVRVTVTMTSSGYQGKQCVIHRAFGVFEYKKTVTDYRTATVSDRWVGP